MKAKKYKYIFYGSLVVVFIGVLSFFLYICYNKNSIMQKGTYDGNLTMVKLAYLFGAEIDEKLYVSICLPDEKYLPVSEFLLDKGANPNKKLKGGKTPFLKSCKCTLEYVKLLLKYGGNIQEQNDNWDTALHYAAKATEAEIIAFLFEKKLNINAQNKLGNTPLIISTQNSRLDNIKLLVKYGADVNITNKEGHTALDFLVLNMKKFPDNKHIAVACQEAIELITKHGGIEGKPITLKRSLLIQKNERTPTPPKKENPNN